MKSRNYIFVLLGLSTTLLAQASVTIHARLSANGVISADWYTLDRGDVVRYKHFKTGAIIEGSIDEYNASGCTVTIKKLREIGEPFGGNVGYSKVYEALDQYKVSLKKKLTHQINLSDNQYLELTLVS